MKRSPMRCLLFVYATIPIIKAAFFQPSPCHTSYRITLPNSRFESHRRRQHNTKPSSFLLRPTTTTTTTTTTAAELSLNPSPLPLDQNTIFTSTTIIAIENIRQYVPLAVSILVIVDILLGSPLLNTIAAPLRRAQLGDDDDDEKTKMTNVVDTDERVDSRKIAQEALEKAKYSKDLREYLEKTKTDRDRMEDMRKVIDKQMRDLESE